MGSYRQEGIRSYRLSGSLLAEAVVACFLLVFAFLAATSIYDYSLRLSQETTQYNLAALIAERKMEEIRALAALGGTEPFIDSLEGIIDDQKPFFSYSDASDYRVEVRKLGIVHSEIKDPRDSLSSTLIRPDAGVISPCSTFFTKPDKLGVTERSTSSPPYKFDSGGDYQRNETFQSYPYSRSMAKSYCLVKVTVGFGVDYKKSFELISLIGDANIDDKIELKILGGSGFIKPGGSDDYRVEVKDHSGTLLNDVSVKWGHSDLLDVFKLNSEGTEVRVTNMVDSVDSDGDATTLTAVVCINGYTVLAKKAIGLR